MQPTALNVLIVPACLAMICGLIGGLALRMLIGGIDRVLSRSGPMVGGTQRMRRVR